MHDLTGADAPLEKLLRQHFTYERFARSGLNQPNLSVIISAFIYPGFLSIYLLLITTKWSNRMYVAFFERNLDPGTNPDLDGIINEPRICFEQNGAVKEFILFLLNLY